MKASVKNLNHDRLSNLLELDVETIIPEPNQAYLYYTVPGYDEGKFPYEEYGHEIHSSKNSVRSGQLLVCKINPRFARIHYTSLESDLPQICSTEFIPFKIDQGRIEPEFLVLFLKTPEATRFFQSRATGTSNSHKRMKPRDILELEIPVPSLLTQRRIAGILTRVMNLRQKRQWANQLTGKIIQSVFLKMFGDPERNSKRWPTRPVHEMARISRKIVKPAQEHQQMIHVGAVNIEGGTGRLVNLKTIAEDGIHSANFLFSRKELLYCKIRPNLRKVALPDFSGLCSADIYPLMPAETIGREFLCNLLRSDAFTRYASSISTSRANIPKINRDELEAYVAMCPPAPMQETFSRLAQRIERMVRLQESSLKETDKLFHSLMHKAFAGEIHELFKGCPQECS
jgi:type I restriction enzyme S subunit